MSVRVMTRVWNAEFPTPIYKLIALKFADCSNDDGENIYPSVTRVESDTGASTATIRAAISDFEASGLLEVIEESFGKRRGKSTTVRAFNLERLSALEGKALAWVYVDVPLTKPTHAGPGKTRKAWRLTDPAIGWVEPDGPIQPLEPTHPTVGAPYKEEPSENHHEVTPKSPDGGLEENLPDEIQDHEATPQSSPSKLLSDLLADGRHHAVVENLFRPILTQRRFSDSAALDTLRSIRSAAKDLPKPALEKAVSIVLAGPKTVKAQRIRDALKAATMVAKAHAADALPVDADTERVRAGLRKRLGDDVYRSWFAGMTVRNDGGRMLLVVERPFYASYVIANFTLDVEAVAGASARVVHAGEVRP